MRTGGRPVDFIFTCEHASPMLPPGYGTLGLGAEALQSHASYDIGAADLVKVLAARFEKHPFMGNYSRLLVDLNRAPDHPAAIPENSFGLEVPGNQRLTAEDRAIRIERYHAPYRQAISRAVNRTIGDGRLCLLISVHSFASVLDGEVRAAPVGVLFDPARALETRIGMAMLAAVRSCGLEARPNYPYSGIDDGLYVDLRRQFDVADYAGVEIEVRQTELAAGGDLLHMADVLEQVARAGVRAATEG